MKSFLIATAAASALMLGPVMKNLKAWKPKNSAMKRV